MSNAKEVKGAAPLNNGLPGVAAGTAFQTGDGRNSGLDGPCLLSILSFCKISITGV